MEHAEGKTHGCSGEFREISPMDRISMTFGWDGMPGQGILNTLDLHDLGGGRTKLVATSTFETPSERDAMLQYGMEGRMSQSYEALDRLLAKL